jgi:uncharacterized membrane protein
MSLLTQTDGLSGSEPGGHAPFSYRASLSRVRRQRDEGEKPCQNKPCQNVGRTERIASVAAGAALALLGLSRKSLGGIAVAGLGGGLLVRGSTGYCSMYDALGIDTSRAPAPSNGRGPHPARNGVHVVKAMLVNKSADELYGFWRNFENLPRIMEHVNSVRVLDEKRSEWTVDAPSLLGGAVTWEAEIIRDEPGHTIAWRSLPESQIAQRGMVTFSPAAGERGVIVRVELEYRPPAGQFGHWIAWLFGDDPAAQVQEDLRTFKRYMELGEVITVEGQSQGSCGGLRSQES